MLKLVFAEAGPSSTVEVGPLPEICIDGETMRATRGGEILGRHQGTNGSCTDGISSAWTARARPRSISRTARASPRRCSVPTKQWYCHRDQRYWDRIVVKSAAAPAA